MGSLQYMCEGLLDVDFDITDNDITTDNLCKWLGAARKMKISEAIESLIKAMANAPEINPMKRATMAETNTIVSFQDNHGVAYLSIVFVANNHVSPIFHIHGWVTQIIERMFQKVRETSLSSKINANIRTFIAGYFRRKRSKYYTMQYNAILRPIIAKPQIYTSVAFFFVYGAPMSLKSHIYATCMMRTHHTVAS